MKLNVFDFDDTLFRIPPHTVAPKDFDISGDVHKWYDSPESLNSEKYVTQCIETIADIARSKDDDTYNILITRRIPELTSQIQVLLEKNGIPMDDLFVIGHHEDKGEVLSRILWSSKYFKSKFEKLTIYEDSLYQIFCYNKTFRTLALHYPIEFEIEYMFVDKTHLIKIDNLELHSLGKLKLSDPI